jgi:hypothetical protein
LKNIKSWWWSSGNRALPKTKQNKHCCTSEVAVILPQVHKSLEKRREAGNWEDFPEETACVQGLEGWVNLIQKMGG